MIEGHLFAREKKTSLSLLCNFKIIIVLAHLQETSGRYNRVKFHISLERSSLNEVLPRKEYMNVVSRDDDE